MIASFFEIVVNILVIILVMVGMILLLVGLHHYLMKGNLKELDDSCNHDFRSEIDKKETVISDYNLFRQFLVSDEEERQKQENKQRGEKKESLINIFFGK